MLDVRPVYETDAKKENARANDGKCDPWGRFWYVLLEHILNCTLQFYNVFIPYNLSTPFQVRHDGYRGTR